MCISIAQETRGQQSLLSAALPRRASRAPPHLRFPKKQTTQKALRVQRRYPQPGREPRRAFVPQSFTLSSSSGKRYCHPGRLCTNLPSPELLRNFLLLSNSTHSAMVSMLWRKSGSTVLSLWMNRSDGRSPGFTPGPGAYRGSPLVCACVAPLSPCLLKQLCAGPPILPPPALAHSFSCKDAAKSVLKDVFAAMCELSPVFPCSFPEVPKCLY
ncbi:uncharacterized protein LOC118223945 isoform X4 [Anguilla anguilla]|uniref:uncharacterized protein LOC118223945 isoform X4 n=1 Tax=Anguilla anguilla TaxID=7936 RepID=UPI0015A9E861|nr:uncharacterized protein LOC118223945 isoform X4 [Anguilla anguilla]